MITSHMCIEKDNFYQVNIKKIAYFLEALVEIMKYNYNITHRLMTPKNLEQNFECNFFVFSSDVRVDQTS
jgi:hypothetical protein